MDTLQRKRRSWHAKAPAPVPWKRSTRKSAKLKQEADTIREAEKSEVADKIKAAIAVYGFTAADLGLSRSGEKASKAAVKAKPKAGKGAGSAPSRIKYQDGAGNAWSGFGRKPKWFVEALASGKTAEELLA